VIYASPLLRAHATAKAIHDAQSEPKPSFIVSPLLREQSFGIAEGQKWTTKKIPGLSNQEHFDRDIFPILVGRDEKFPQGESLNDLKDRAEEAIDELVMPHVWQTLKEGKTDVDIALVSHGLCISELVAALVRKDSKVEQGGAEGLGGKYTGLLNTAWTRISIDTVV
jgi:broad specificity phosphatase PhoE